MNLQKSRKTGTHKEQGTKKNNKKKDQKTPAIVTPSNEKITKYFVRKHQDEDDIKQQSEDKIYQEQDNSDILSSRRQEQKLCEMTGRYQEKLKCDIKDMKKTFEHFQEYVTQGEEKLLRFYHHSQTQN